MNLLSFFIQDLIPNIPQFWEKNTLQVACSNLSLSFCSRKVSILNPSSHNRYYQKTSCWIHVHDHSQYIMRFTCTRVERWFLHIMFTLDQNLRWYSVFSHHFSPLHHWIGSFSRLNFCLSLEEFKTESMSGGQYFAKIFHHIKQFFNIVLVCFSQIVVCL